VREFLSYGPGIPRYVALWLPLAPALLACLLAGRVRRSAVAVVLATTLPTFALHMAPAAVPAEALVLGVAAVLAVAGAWAVGALRQPEATAGPPQPRRAWAVAAAVLLALALRVPLAWLDPGIGDFGPASEFAAEQVLSDRNPYLVPNPYATVGTYQYPAATILAFLPASALLPAELGGEAHLPARATSWAVDALAVVLLARGAARLGQERAGLVAAFAYALHPTLVRESGLVVANDVLLAVLAAAAALALAGRRPLLAAAAVGVAVSVKPAALVLVPLLLAAAGWRAAAVSLAVPAALQLPFLLLPRPGLQGVNAIAEPAARLDAVEVLRLSLWGLLYRAVPPTEDLLRVLSAVGVLVSAAVGWWAGRRLASGVPGLRRAGAAVALPLLAAFALATRWPTNFQDWYLVPLLLAVSAVRRRDGP
jgi:hypothetical protein